MPPATLVRLPRDGGTAELYRVPALKPITWKIDQKLPPLARPIGADPEQGLVFALDRSRNVVAVDLDTRRVRTYLTGVREATLGPDGALYAVDTGSAVTQLVRRTPVRFRSKLRGTPQDLHASMSGAVLARMAGDRPALQVLGSDQAPVAIPLPGSRMAATFLGDLVAVAADSAIVLYETQGERERRSIPVAGHARAVLFSPSGHRLYVAREVPKLLVLDRFGEEVLREIDLPGPAAGLRSDTYGSWILVRPEGGNSVWVVDAARGRYVGAAATRWTEQLPAVAAPATLLTRRGADLVARDLSDAGLPETGRVEGGADDYCLPVAWYPAGEAPLLAADSAAADSAADSLAAGRTVYLQVSSSRNPSWAGELAGRLRGAGLPASVIAPKRQDEAYRVVLGPYATREQAEATGRRLGMPSFVVTAEGEPTQ